MNTKLIEKYRLLEEETKDLLKVAITETGLPARAYDKILKVSRTVSDLAGSEDIKTEHLSEAIQYRSLDRDGKLFMEYFLKDCICNIPS